MHEKLKKCMMKFSTEELKGFLGENIVDSLLEWNTGSDAFSSKSKLSDMILCIHGLSILKNKEFRRRLLKTMDHDTIMDFRIDLPRYKDCQDVYVIIDAVADSNWRESDINRRFLRLIGYMPETVFEKKTVSENPVIDIDSHDKFYELFDYQYIIRQKALNYLNSEYGLRRFLIHMPTGTGKTKTATHIICNH